MRGIQVPDVSPSIDFTGAVHISPARGRAFLEVMAEDESAARTVVETLPMAK